MVMEGLEFETTRVRPGCFRYRVRRVGSTTWTPGSDFMHGRASDPKTKTALAHYGRLDLERAGA